MVTAVAPVVINGNGLWVGWPGIHLEDPNEPIPESDPNDITPTAGLKSKKVKIIELVFHKKHVLYHVLVPMCQLLKKFPFVRSRFIWLLCFVLQKRKFLSSRLRKHSVFFSTGLPTHRDIGATFRVNKRKMLFLA